MVGQQRAWQGRELVLWTYSSVGAVLWDLGRLAQKSKQLYSLALGGAITLQLTCSCGILQRSSSSRQQLSTQQTMALSGLDSNPACTSSSRPPVHLCQCWLLPVLTGACLLHSGH